MSRFELQSTKVTKLGLAHRVSNVLQCFKMKSQAICRPIGLFSATLEITRGASDDLIFFTSREN